MCGGGRAATDLCPHAGAPSVSPALRGSARPPRASGPRSSGLGPERPERQRTPPHPRVPAGGRAAVPSCERAGEAASGPGGGERGARRELTSEPASPARERASEGRQAVRSSFESNCLSQEEMWHLMQREGRGKGPSRLRTCAPRQTQGQPGPTGPRLGRSCLRATRTHPCLSQD